jgi:iron complex outermembrane receptor protein
MAKLQSMKIILILLKNNDIKNILTVVLFTLCSINIQAQESLIITGKVVDATNQQALSKVTITDADKKIVLTDYIGNFSITSKNRILTIACVGYNVQTIKIEKKKNILIGLFPSTQFLQDVIISANKTIQKRIEAPIAIASINAQTISDTKAQRLDNLLNKISGVTMVSIGNEQHTMSIRQPITLKSLFLYMEDGIPIRTSGVFSNNALLEMNLTAAKSIEIIKGPSSAMYGAEAIGGAVNIITQAAPAYNSGFISTQFNNNGFKKTESQLGASFKKWGIIASYSYADKKNGNIQHSDFHKAALNLRTDFKINEKTNWVNTLAYIDYYTEMTGSLDSIKFTQKNYDSPHSFTFRSVAALRIKSMLHHQSNKNSETDFTFLYRKNSMKQNPSYLVASTSNPSIFKGQINENAFSTYALFAQHIQKFKWLNSKLIGGTSIDISPQKFYAQFIWIQKDLTSGNYTGYTYPSKDSLLSNYTTGISNIAGFVNYEATPFKNVRFVMAYRFDRFTYNFKNSLTTTFSSGAPSTTNNFSRFTPKLGFTYNINNIGFYTNYSEGYVPPQITELYNSTKVPYLLPQTFANYEIGGWLSFLKNKLYGEWSLYLLNGTNEIISVKQADNTNANQNAGSTRHYGLEYSIKYKPNNQLQLNIGGTNAKHYFVQNIVKGIDYSGKTMNAAPSFTSNVEIIYKPNFVKGFRISGEWNHQSPYFMDDLNNFKYKGFDLINFRTGYQIKKVELWLNVLNILNEYYSPWATKVATTSGNASYSYYLGDPREITFGVSYKFGK